MHDLAEIFPSPPVPPAIEPDIKVSFILSPKFTLLPFAGFIDCLRHAADEADHSRQIYCQWQVVAPEVESIHASCGVKVTPTNTIRKTGDSDYLVICGGRLPWCLDVPDETLQFICDSYHRGTTIIGLCTGSFIIAKAGLLSGKRCALHSMHRTQFEKLFPDTHPTTDRNYLSDQGIITCNGGTSTIDLACEIIETHSGKARALKALNGLVVDSRRTAHHMPHRPYAHLTTCGNWRVEQATAMMEQNFSSPHSVSTLANQLSSSTRELNRAFNKHAHASPSQIYRKMRLAHGSWLLNNSSRTITQISLECGFSDAAHFSRWFKKTYGKSPSVFRELN